MAGVQRVRGPGPRRARRCTGGLLRAGRAGRAVGRLPTRGDAAGRCVVGAAVRRGGDPAAGRPARSWSRPATASIYDIVGRLVAQDGEELQVDSVLPLRVDLEWGSASATRRRCGSGTSSASAVRSRSSWPSRRRPWAFPRPVQRGQDLGRAALGQSRVRRRGGGGAAGDRCPRPHPGGARPSPAHRRRPRHLLRARTPTGSSPPRSSSTPGPWTSSRRSWSTAPSSSPTSPACSRSARSRCCCGRWTGLTTAGRPPAVRRAGPGPPAPLRGGLPPRRAHRPAGRRLREEPPGRRARRARAARGATGPRWSTAATSSAASLRTQDGVRPVYVSPGHLIGVEQAADVVLGAVLAPTGCPTRCAGPTTSPGRR